MRHAPAGTSENNDDEDAGFWVFQTKKKGLKEMKQQRFLFFFTWLLCGLLSSGGLFFVLAPIQAFARETQTHYVPCSQTLSQEVEQAEATRRMTDGGMYRLQVQLWAMMDSRDPTQYCGKASAKALLWVPSGGRVATYCVLLNPSRPMDYPVACWGQDPGHAEPLTEGGPYTLQTDYGTTDVSAALANSSTAPGGLDLNVQTLTFPVI